MTQLDLEQKVKGQTKILTLTKAMISYKLFSHSKPPRPMIREILAIGPLAMVSPNLKLNI